MQFTQSLALAAATLATFASAQDNHGMNHSFYGATYVVPQGMTVQSFTGSMTVPRLPHKGWYYLWPGLQPPSDGVLQPVLSGGSGHWNIFNTWYTGDMGWGSGDARSVHDVKEGQVINFAMTNNGGWSNSLNIAGTSQSWTDSFKNITADKAQKMNLAEFTIELWGQAWDFGQLKFNNATIVAAGSDKSWCNENPHHDRTAISISGVKASAANGKVTCSIASLTLDHATVNPS